MQHRGIDARGRSRAEQRGIALGPVLFIITILAVLAGVLAKTTGVFNTASGSERSRLHAQAIVEQANQMRLGVERMVAQGVNVGTGATECASFDQNDPQLYLDWASGGACDAWGRYAMFDRLGGAVTRPTPPAEALPQANQVRTSRAWQFVKNADIENVGRADGDFVAAIEVTQPVCIEVNDLLYNTGATGRKDGPPTLAASADITLVTATGADGMIDVASATSAVSGTISASTSGATFQIRAVAPASGATVTNIDARSEGCVGNGATPARYFFFKTLNVQ